MSFPSNLPAYPRLQRHAPAVMRSLRSWISQLSVFAIIGMLLAFGTFYLPVSVPIAVASSGCSFLLGSLAFGLGWTFGQRIPKKRSANIGKGTGIYLLLVMSTLSVGVVGTVNVALHYPLTKEALVQVSQQWVMRMVVTGGVALGLYAGII